MRKLAVGPGARGEFDLDDFNEYVRRVADVLTKPLESLTCAVLDRERNDSFVRVLRQLDCRIKLIDQGDVAQSIATYLEDSPVDMLAGTGNSAGTALSSVVLQCFEGDFPGQFHPIDDSQQDRHDNMEFTNYRRKFDIKELTGEGNSIVACRGVKEGQILNGVRRDERGVITHSLILTINGHTLATSKILHKK